MKHLAVSLLVGSKATNIASSERILGHSNRERQKLEQPK